ncbi:5'-nucleotidase, lipoprotein e(P4) family [Erwinia psidii]|uniref:5'-nucleotidase, lipoprotein e(P4) family n=1 Tax=Erwinia psidii TaxID=69224 RepID=A0A3N6SCU5_9GAMM|nr:5'-nucleotidase, lipoprotein e(P4) family [Erwinia psidii]MCX8959463.1 5'-nucleotidase, lipoprotein e(P4) family [Erwinia psidii]MCX8961855.1 5'-nucleotidase, lipoprotein e(P4) family [Erwinia psidii]MCX8966567.1 5'-nucleotidase, lipoprotein e(P4) family [Erwinia psidii]RQM37713.1 5'-nucleotidase, lipoprotein e(P4) family [Erwinia psidii]
MNSIYKVLLLALPVISASAAAADEQLCQPKAYEMALRYQQKSAEIMALQLQTYRFATERFEKKINALKSPEKYAVVMDLDETVLDNSALLVRDVEQCHDYTKWDTWDEWEKQGKPGLIPGAKAFLDEVNRHHVRIYYVSDRSQKNKPDTLNTLKSLGLPQVSEDSVLLDTASKEERRQSILKHQQIMMLFGDSLPDFAVQFKNKKPTGEQRQLVGSSEQHFGDDWIVLPNASYGSWSKADLDSWKETTVK